jgi:hypothetical protein
VISLGMSLSMKLGLAVPLVLAPHGVTHSPPVPAPMVRAVPATGPPLSLRAVLLPPVSPKVPVRVDPIAGGGAVPTPVLPPVNTPTAPVSSVCTVHWPAGTFVGTCAEAETYAEVDGGVVTPGAPS